MKFYMAPMEGITKYEYRNAYAARFAPMDRYFSPFIAPTSSLSFKNRELSDVLPEVNKAVPLIPQVLTNRADAFVWAAKRLGDLGYEEVNLNLGCPSKTVVSKGRGSGMLADPENLDRFLDAVFSEWTGNVSVKTRIGIQSPDEWAALLHIYNQYPITELIVHPRCKKDYYGGVPDLDAFALAVSESKHPLCYNGDIFTPEDLRKLTERFPQIDCVMLGRGILCNPGLLNVIHGEKLPDVAVIRDFLEEITEAYSAVFSGERNVLFKLKEVWCYLQFLFPADPKRMKKIRKAERMSEYRAAAEEIFSCHKPVQRRFGDGDIKAV